MTDVAMFDFFIRENDAWEDMIRRHKREIPNWERMLEQRLDDHRTMPAAARANLQYLQEEMGKQHHLLLSLQHELDEQQRFLVNGQQMDTDSLAIHSLSRQNLLRERIRTAERTFIELKCNFLNQLAAVL